MSTESNRKWTRIDKRMALARDLVNKLVSGEREYVINQLGCGRDYKGRRIATVRGQLLAAVVYQGLQHRQGCQCHAAVQEICEAIARERTP